MPPPALSPPAVAAPAPRGFSPAQVRDHLMSGPSCLPYTSSATDTWDGVRSADGTAGRGTEACCDDLIRLLYTRHEVPAGDRGKEYLSGWCREHAWPRSRGGFGCASPGAGTDLHNLFAADVSVNSARGNRDFADVDRTDPGARRVTDRSPARGRSGETGCWTHPGGYWEPSDEAKGPVARALFYMACMYGGSGLRLVESEGTCSAAGALGNLPSLLRWNRRFPPDACELRRNASVESVQGNRNPFIDFPALADGVDWGRV